MSAPENLNAAWAQALIEELCRGGVEHAVVCPGSRSAPLALACARAPGLRVHTAIDERSGAFVALGAGKATGRPALVLATSGTAGAHFYPAVLEAEAMRVPLLCLTADRPPELHGFGAPQTLDQRALFGGHVRAFVELATPEGTDAAFLHLRAQASLAARAALRVPRGPVHLNAPFREPLAPLPQPLPPLSARARDGEGALPALAVHPPARAPDGAALRRLAAELARRPRGALAVGPRDEDDDLAGALDELSRATGWPVYADGASGLRAKAEGAFVCHADLLLRHERAATALRPEMVLRLGGGLTSKVLQQWLDGSGALTALLPGDGALIDAAHAASLCIEGDAAAACRALAEEVRALRGSPGELRSLALRADAAAATALASAFQSRPLDEPQLAWALARALPPGSQLFVASSMPVRDVDAFSGALPGVRVLSSRGANGIDGIVSTAAGMALATQRPTAVLCGDLALLHDLGGLVAAKRAGADLAVVVANNDGGGIFHFLPVHGLAPAERFEQLFATPHGLDLAHAAALAQARLHRPRTGAEVRTALAQAREGGLHLVEVRTDRARNVADHREVQARVLAALEALPWS